MAAELYRHTQPGTLTRWLLGGFAILDFGFLMFFTVHFVPAVFSITCAVLFIMLACLLLFHSLTVIVTEQEIMISFGPGLLRKKYPLSELVSCQVVRNSWLHGWGIHRTWAGWVYNVSGFDAVEIVLKDGRKARIGTDAPRELAEALNERMKAKTLERRGT
ncbi:MAG: hypothetical protein ABSE73_23370 [Planctomycetota bacterium]